MAKIKFDLHFNTPGFLGDAYQKGHWRTPPFKALIRQWWRVVKACDLISEGHDLKHIHKEIREKEGRLFGHAWLEYKGKKWASRSRVRLKLDKWNKGNLRQLPKIEPVYHQEVPQKKINPILYLAYGPTSPNGPNSIKISKPPAISTEESNTLTITCPDEYVDEIKKTISLANLFGGVGGRSRNGFGSIIFKINNDQGSLLSPENLLDNKRKELRKFSRPFSECMELDWCHAIGSDEKGLLLWKTKKEAKTWEKTIRELAEIKIAYRLQFKFHIKNQQNKNRGNIHPRHIISYPVTRHFYSSWRNKRAANQIFFKVHKLSNNRFMGLAVHLSHALPSELSNLLSQNDKLHLTQLENETWEKVHKVLDNEMERLP